MYWRMALKVLLLPSKLWDYGPCCQAPLTQCWRRKPGLCACWAGTLISCATSPGRGDRPFCPLSHWPCRWAKSLQGDMWTQLAAGAFNPGCSDVLSLLKLSDWIDHHGVKECQQHMQMSRGSESASHADNFYVDNLP